MTSWSPSMRQSLCAAPSTATLFGVMPSPSSRSGPDAALLRSTTRSARTRVRGERQREIERDFRHQPFGRAIIRALDDRDGDGGGAGKVVQWRPM
jgi:hypothetical protein